MLQAVAESGQRRSDRAGQQRRLPQPDSTSDAVEFQARLRRADDRYSPKTALRNADLLIKEGVNLVLEFQTYEHVAPIISSKFIDANIPVVAIEIPHPGAVYFGADNYRAGLIGGQALGRWARENWGGEVEALLLMELPIAGPLPQLRIS